MLCVSETLKFNIPVGATSLTCTYIFYHVIMAIIAGVLVLFWFITKQQRNARIQGREVGVYYLLALIFGFEGLLIYILIEKFIDRHTAAQIHSP